MASGSIVTVINVPLLAIETRYNSENSGSSGWGAYKTKNVQTEQSSNFNNGMVS